MDDMPLDGDLEKLRLRVALRAALDAIPRGEAGEVTWARFVELRELYEEQLSDALLRARFPGRPHRRRGRDAF
jgi:hypothetical protein